MGKFRVMLVDDEIWALKGLEKIVNWERYGFMIAAECRDGKEALEKLMAEPYDVIFTDLSMDVMDGKAFVRALRERGLKTEVVIVSAYTDFEAAREGIRLGVFDYILKPYHAEEIKELLIRLDNYLTEKNRKEMLVELDRNTELDEKQLAELAGTIGGEYPYIYIRPLAMNSMDYEEKRKTLQKFAAGELVNCRYISGAEAVLFASNMPIDGAMSETERIGISLTGEKLEDLKLMLLEAAFSRYLKQPYSADPSCRKMQQYILHNATRNVSLEEIAESVFLSKSYASSYFSKSTGLSLGEYQKKTRMFAACDLLQGTDLAVADIAAIFGFEDPSYFSKVFKSEFGIMPKEYRKK